MAQSAPTTDTDVQSITPTLKPANFTSPQATTFAPFEPFITSSPLGPVPVEQSPARELSLPSTSTVSTTAPITSTTTPTPITTATFEQASVTTPVTSSAPATDTLKDVKSTSPMSSPHESQQTQTVAILEKSNFTCYSKNLGYYADMQEECRVYHFCLLGEYSGESVYQRITYKCLNDTYFDQQALDCVDHAKMSAPCGESYLYYETSNVILRQAVVGTKTVQNINSTITS